MNSKKNKHKNRPSKPPNPNPPQTVQNVTKSEEKVEPVVEQTSDIKEENVFVMEVSSETVKVQEETETPKKPKRNKGKKKNQDKDESVVDISEEKIQQVNLIEPDVTIQEKNKEEKTDILQEEPVDVSRATPNVRKKKNKKKLQADFVEESVSPAETAEIDQILSPEKCEKVDTEIIELSPLKSDGKKKKNKKNKRNDSEKSDKCEEVVSCTSAFEALVVDDDKSKKIESEEKCSEEIQIIEAKFDAFDLNVSLIKDATKNEENVKNKNKKEKIQIKTDALIPGELIQDEHYVSESKEFQMENEASPKPKAKIAKPVEKKRKGKPDSQAKIQQTVEIPDKMVEIDISPQALPEESQTEIPSTSVIEAKNASMFEPSASAENVNISCTLAQGSLPDVMGKKRKKTPIISSTAEITNILSELSNPVEKILVEDEKTNISDTKQELSNPETLESLSAKEVVATKKCELTETKTIKSQEINIPIATETTHLEPTLTPVIKAKEEIEIKINKKKKKNPKNPTVTADKTSVLMEAKKCEDVAEKPLYLFEERRNVNVPILPDIEIQSVRTDGSECSSCDVTPDVLFVRSSSQQLLDDNNNTYIQEVINIEELKLNDPLLIPLIEGSGETPMSTPELTSSGIKIAELEIQTPEEKTDLKSKMMEVNQDMEGLRLSIEKSLAEFTAMEKHDIEPEQATDTNSGSNKDVEDRSTTKSEKEKSEVVQIQAQDNIPFDPKVIQSLSPSDEKPDLALHPLETIPASPMRKDNKNKGKSKKKGKQEFMQLGTTFPQSATTQSGAAQSESKKSSDDKNKSEQKTETTQEKGKQQALSPDTTNHTDAIISNPVDSNNAEKNDFEPIEYFEDALTSSNDDVNKTFEMIAKEADDDNDKCQKKLAANKPHINITEPDDTSTKKDEKVNPVSQPKNLLGHNDIPVQSNKTDYKKEKNKTPNARQARVKIKDSNDIESKKQSKESQTDSKKSSNSSDKSVKESFMRVSNENEEYVYKYSFRKVFLQSACNVCNKDLCRVRVPCGYCSLVFYCGPKHKDEDWPLHQALCFTVSTIAHMKDQKHIYADAQNVTGQDYRLLRMQMIVSCEKILKRRLVPWEQEAMLYPRICCEVTCREWKQGKLKDCEGCGQVSYCASHPDHLPKSHQRWCKSYCLYQKLVSYQQTKGRLEPKLPTKVMAGNYKLPAKMNEVLASMYEEKIDMNDIQYASLTQLATAPLTAAYCLQLCNNKIATSSNGVSKRQFTIHVVGAELQFEADALHKWEVFFLHLLPMPSLKVVLVSPALNPGNLPLDLLGKIRLCENCKENGRRVVFSFQDSKTYHEYRSSEDFINPDMICAFNPSIQRSAVYNGKDPWPQTLNAILKLQQPFVLTAYSLVELRKDIARIKQTSEVDFKILLDTSFNNFASVRPDRNFITDDEMPLLFKNYCVAVLLGC